MAHEPISPPSRARSDRIRRPLLTVAVHLTGAGLTLVALGAALALATAGPIGIAFEPSEVCAGILDLPERQVVATTVGGREACAVFSTPGEDTVATIPLQPVWWPWAAGACAVLLLAALVPVVAALLLRHTSRPRRAREAWNLLGVALAVAVIACGATAWTAAHAQEINSDEVAAARALAPPPEEHSPTPTPSPTTRPASRAGSPGEAPACTAADLRLVRTGDATALGGKVGSTIAAENVSKSACLLHGPSLPVITDSGGNPVELTVERLDAQRAVLRDDAVQAVPVLLVPGSRATAMLEWNWSQHVGATSPPSDTLLLRLSDDTEATVHDEPAHPGGQDNEPIPFAPPAGSTLRIDAWRSS